MELRSLAGGLPPPFLVSGLASWLSTWLLGDGTAGNVQDIDGCTLIFTPATLTAEVKPGLQVSDHVKAVGSPASTVTIVEPKMQQKQQEQQEQPAHILDLLILEPACAVVALSLDFVEAWKLRAVCHQTQILLRARVLLTKTSRLEQISDNRKLARTQLAQIMESVLAHPHFLEESDCAGRTPLMRAAHLGIPKLCRVLLVARAAVNARGGNGWTALHYAATSSSKSAETCQLLLDQGANLEARSHDGCTPFYYAYRAGDDAEVMRVLHGRGARPDLRSQNASGTADWGYLRYSERKGMKKSCSIVLARQCRVALKGADSGHLVALKGVLLPKRWSRTW